MAIFPTKRRKRRSRRRRRRASVRIRAVTTATAAGAPAASTPSAPPAGSNLPIATSRERLHLNRFGTGFTQAALAGLRAAGSPEAWLEAQMVPASVPESAKIAEVDGWFPHLLRTPAEKAATNSGGSKKAWEYGHDLGNWSILRRTYSERSVLETMVEFWTSVMHIPTGHDRAWVYQYDYDATIRRLAFGSFEDLLTACSLHPAMRVYLDNWRSVRGKPNENQGRELLELHSVGRTGGYTEAMVKSSAVLLSGYSVDWGKTYAPIYNAAAHTTGPVHVLDFTHPNASADGQAATQQYLTYLAHHPATARYLMTKLATFFVSDSPSPELIDALAAVYLSSGTSISAVLRELLHAPGVPYLRGPQGAYAGAGPGGDRPCSGRPGAGPDEHQLVGLPRQLRPWRSPAVLLAAAGRASAHRQGVVLGVPAVLLLQDAPQPGGRLLPAAGDVPQGCLVAADQGHALRRVRRPPLPQLAGPCRRCPPGEGGLRGHRDQRQYDDHGHPCRGDLPVRASGQCPARHSRPHDHVRLTMTDHTAPGGESCCSDFTRSQLSRRSILQGAAAVGGGLAVTQMFGDAMMQATFAGTPGGNTLVVISLRGGIDGLGVVVPHGDPEYYKARPSTAVPVGSLLAKDAMFGLHPAMAPLEPLWKSGRMAAIQATGLAVPTRSHFAAIEQVEDAAPGSSARSGWINRMIGLGPANGTLDAVQLGMNFPTTALVGPSPVLATGDLNGLLIPGIEGNTAPRYSSLQTAWAGAEGPLASGAREAVALSKGPGARLKAMPESQVAYPTAWNAGPFAKPLKNAAKLIRADLGTDVIAIDGGGWDMHTNYGTLSSGSMQSNLAGLSSSLAAFMMDLGELSDRVTVVTISEFGRRVAENGNRSFDHGWGNMMLVAGAGVKGGQYYGSWPGLGTANQVDGDLKVTTDYRNVLGEIVSKRFPDRSLPALFPGLSHAPLGVMV